MPTGLTEVDARLLVTVISRVMVEVEEEEEDEAAADLEVVGATTVVLEATVHPP